MADQLVADDFVVPAGLTTERFRLEPLGPEHNESDHAAWTSSIDHIRVTPGFPYGDWPPLSGMTLEANLADLQGHARDFAQRTGFTYTVLEPEDGEVIGCVYIYPSRTPGFDTAVRCWVRADRAELDGPLATAVEGWLSRAWRLGSLDFRGR
ncbi:GNAT family N-acetyltransferase [Pseudonocardia alaniniphila]|uniref:N-acetyltransferase n=1 Tax=Pseudonocardia alaniniphila TaxID=75291 RepID=A0ABS9THH2_9PSEU|nr:N-acetyltransferase [Pseudonocardia alaniniphila]MCH6167997.1 N-acetyltransferase [Pseudonocardia alaniniphila]